MCGGWIYVPDCVWLGVGNDLHYSHIGVLRLCKVFLLSFLSVAWPGEIRSTIGSDVDRDASRSG